MSLKGSSSKDGSQIQLQTIAVRSGEALHVPDLEKKHNNLREDESYFDEQKLNEKFGHLDTLSSKLKDMVNYSIVGVTLQLIVLIIISFVISSSIVSDAESALLRQTARSSNSMVKSLGEIFENIFEGGVLGFMLPSLLFSVDKLTKDNPSTYQTFPICFHVEPLESFANTEMNFSGAFPSILKPSEEDFRFISMNISTEFSSVYFKFQTTKGLENQWNSAMDLINATSYMDIWAPEYWEKNKNFVSSYFGSERDDPLMRIYPGVVDKTYETENYDPKSRPWYQQSQSLAESVIQRSTPSVWNPLKDPMEIVYYTPPYRDFNRKVWMISLSQAAYYPQPSCISQGYLYCGNSHFGQRLGVYGLDLEIDELFPIVDRVKSRKTGEAHIFMTDVNQVFLSPQWKNEGDSKKITSIRLKTRNFTQADLNILRDTAKKSGSFETDGMLVSYYSFSAHKFTAVVVTPKNEAEESISTQKTDIYVEALWLGVICTVITVLVISFQIFSVRKSKKSIVIPMTKFARKANRISENIGKEDLLEGIEMDEKIEGFSEIEALDKSFSIMLRDLKQMREKRGQWQATKNILHGTNLLELVVSEEELKYQSFNVENKVEDQVSQRVSPQPTQPVKPAPTALFNAPPNDVEFSKANDFLNECKIDSLGENEIKFYDKHRIEKQCHNNNSNESSVSGCSFNLLIIWSITLPMLLCLIVMALIPIVTMNSSAPTWIEPVKVEMLEEETRTFPLRADAIRDQVEGIFRKLSVTVNMFHAYTENLWNGKYNASTREKVFYYPTTGIGTSNEWTVTPDGGVSQSLRFPFREDNIKTSGFYKNGKSGYENENGYIEPFSDTRWQTEWLPEVKKLYKLDEGARAMWLSNNYALYVYVATEKNEIMYAYPYVDGTSMTYWEGNCVAILGNPKRIGYTPVCRPWYYGAKHEPNKELFYDSVSIDAITGRFLLTLSKGLFDEVGDFWGVAAIDFMVVDLREAIFDVDLYENGYTFLLDATATVAIHPKVDDIEGSPQSITNIEFADCLDSEYFKYFDDNIKVLMIERVDGNARVKKCDGEIWLISWRAVRNTSYILGVFLPEKDIMQPTDQLTSDVNSLLSSALGTAIAWLCIIIAVFFFLSLAMSRRLSSPLKSLSRHIDTLHESSYVKNTPDFEDPFREFAPISKSMDDLLIALRFGNPKFAKKGGMKSELENYKKALDLMIDNDNENGMGICYANIGEITNRINLQNQSNYLLSSIGWIEKAISIARKILEKNQNENNEIALLQRLFNLAMIMNQKPVAYTDRIKEILNEMNKISVSNPIVLSHLAFVLASKILETNGPYFVEDESKFDPDEATSPIHQLMKNLSVKFARKALQSYFVQAENLSSDDAFRCISTSLFALGVNSDIAFVILLLTKVPQININIFCKSIFLIFTYSKSNPNIFNLDFLGNLKEELLKINDIFWNFDDLNVSEFYNTKDQMMSFLRRGLICNFQRRPKHLQLKQSVVFCLDTSASMYGNRLDICKKSILSIVEKFDSSARVSLITFDSKVKIEYQGKKYESEEFKESLNNAKASGATKFYGALETGGKIIINELSKERRRCWLVALTDGEDNMSGPNDFLNVEKNLRKHAINLAIITVGEVNSREITNLINIPFSDCVRTHVVANDTSKIKEAFNEVEKIMADSSTVVGEYL